MGVTNFKNSSIKDGRKYKSFSYQQYLPFSATGGSEVVTVGGYKYHMFDASSSFVVTEGSKACEILVIGAGGGGGHRIGGGGGAGAKEPASGYLTLTLS